MLLLRSVSGVLRTVRRSLMTVRDVLRTVRDALRTVRDVLRTVRDALRTVRDALRTVRDVLRTVRGALRTVRGVLSSVNCKEIHKLTGLRVAKSFAILAAAGQIVIHCVVGSVLVVVVSGVGEGFADSVQRSLCRVETEVQLQAFVVPCG